VIVLMADAEPNDKNNFAQNTKRELFKGSDKSDSVYDSYKL